MREDVLSHEEKLRAHANDPIKWRCTKKHSHTTRGCDYVTWVPTIGDVLFLLGMIDNYRKLLADARFEEV